MKSVGGNKVEQSGELDPRDTSGTKRCAARLSACESSLRQHTRHVARCARECAKEEDASPRRTHGHGLFAFRDHEAVVSLP